MCYYLFDSIPINKSFFKNIIFIMVQEKKNVNKKNTKFTEI